MANGTNLRIVTLGACLGASAWLAWLCVAPDVPPLLPTGQPTASEPATAPTTRATPTPEAERAGNGGAAEESESRRLAVPTNPHAPRVVRGRVRLGTGQPAAEVTVAIGANRTKTKSDGTFQLACPSDDADLVAMRRGHEPTVVEAVASRPEVVDGRELTIELLGPAATIRGWLIDADGNPCSGVRPDSEGRLRPLWHVDLHGGGTECGHDGLPQLMAEDLAAGADELSIQGWTKNASPTTNPNDRPVGVDGSFTISGLRTGRDYVLRARNDTTLQTATSLPIRAGTQGFRFVVPEGRWRERVHGRVVDRNGGAINDVRVRLTMRVHRNGSGETYQTGQDDRTRGNGRFSFLRVPHEDLLLRFDQGDVESLYHELRADDPGEDLVILLSSQCRFRCEPAANLPTPATLRVLDELDRPLRVEQRFADGTSRGGQRLDVPAGGGDYAVSDRATWLVFEVDERTIRRLPIRLRRGEFPVVRG